MEGIERLLGSLEEFKKTTTMDLAKMDGKIEAILIQTTKTNGRVSQIELERVEEKQSNKDARKRKVEVKDKWLWALVGAAISIGLLFISNIIKK